MQLGIDQELVQLLGSWSPIPVTYAGGARTMVGTTLAGRSGHGDRVGSVHVRAGCGDEGGNRERGGQALPVCQACPARAVLHGTHLQEDLELVRQAGGGRVDITVGSALDIFGGKLAYADVVAWHQHQQGMRC